MKKTSLTERRKQFLRGLFDLYQRTQLPVHYQTLAHLLGVSKWTAYDMLKELERLGYLKRDYTENPNETGRFQIVFRPTAKTVELFSQNWACVPSDAHMEAIKTKVLHLMNRLKEAGPVEAVRKVLDEIDGVDSRVAFCAHLMGILLIIFRTLGHNTASLVRSLVQSTPGMEMRLTMFVGTVVGAAIQTIGEGLSSELAQLVGGYLKLMRDLSDSEIEMLASLLDDAVVSDPVVS